MSAKKERLTPATFDKSCLIISPDRRKSEFKTPYAKIQYRKKPTAADAGKKKKKAPAFKLCIEKCQVSNIFAYEHSKPEIGLLHTVVSVDSDYYNKVVEPFDTKYTDTLNDKIEPHREHLGMADDYKIPKSWYFDEKIGRWCLFCSISMKNAVDQKTQKQLDYGKYVVEKTNGESVSLHKLKTIGYAGIAAELVPEIKGKDGKMRCAWKLYKGIMAKPAKNDFASTADLRAESITTWGEMTAEDEALLNGADDDSESGEINIKDSDSGSESDSDAKSKKVKKSKAKSKNTDDSDETPKSVKVTKKAPKESSDSESDEAPPKASTKAVKKDSDSGSDNEKPAKKAEDPQSTGSAKVKVSRKKFSPAAAVNDE